MASQEKEAATKNPSFSVGIDFGTTYSCVGVWDGENGVDILPDEHGTKKIHYCVAFKDSTVLVGDVAHHQIINNFHNSIVDVKSLIGKKLCDISDQRGKKQWQFNVAENSDGKLMVPVAFRDRARMNSPEIIASMILSKLRGMARDHVGCPVKNAAIAVPHLFDDSQRAAIVDAANVTGLNVVLIEEPAEIALAYGFWKNSKEKETFLICDFGGGGLKMQLLAVGPGVHEVRANAEDSQVGGDELDNQMVAHCVKKFKDLHNVDLSGNIIATKRLKNACEQTKSRLSSASTAFIEVLSLHEGIDFNLTLTRGAFEHLSHDLFIKWMDCVQKCLEEAKLDVGDVPRIILAGGCSRIPIVKQLLSTVMNQVFQPPVSFRILEFMDPDTVVCEGAAHYAKLSGY